MENNTLVAGVVVVIILAILQLFGWYFGQDGILTGTIMLIIGLICGAIFGFKFNPTTNTTN